MAFNEIYTSWRIFSIPPETPLKEKVDLLARGAKTTTLRKLLMKKIDQHQKDRDTIEHESVEIFLYYETSLKDEINLLSAIESMSYEAIGKRDWIVKEKLALEVKENFFDSLFANPHFEKLLKEDASFLAAYETCIKPIDNAIQDTTEEMALIVLTTSKSEELNKLKTQFYERQL
jgi:hypothetical protein